MKRAPFVAALLISLSPLAFAASKPAEPSGSEPKKDEGPLSSATLAGLTLRSIGPALTSGRISDLAVDPTDSKVWWIGVASGGVWKTTNAGTTWSPVFDGEGSYSIGALTIDPKNPSVVWVGTGENNNQRSVAYGDGLYRTLGDERGHERVAAGDGVRGGTQPDQGQGTHAKHGGLRYESFHHAMCPPFGSNGSG